MRKAIMGRFILTVTLLFLTASTIYADGITMRNGDVYEGIIGEITDGEVRVEINREMMTFDIRDIESMNFDTPHLIETGDEAVDHFLSDIESQEIVEAFAELDETAAELEGLMTQVRTYWEAREPIDSRDV